MKTRAAAVVVVTGWAGFIVVAIVWGRVVADAQPEDPAVGAVPLFGRWDLLLTWRLLVPIAVAAFGVTYLPRWCATVRWRRLVLLAAAAAVVWTVALGIVDGGDALTYSVAEDYGDHIDLVEKAGPGGFLRDYVDGQSQYPTHLQAHPPGLVLGLWAAAQVGLQGGGFHLLLTLTAVALATVAALTILVDVAGVALARVAAPFVALAPAAVWHTNADVIYGGVALAAVALVVRAIVQDERRLPPVLCRQTTDMPLFADKERNGAAIAGGALFGVALLLTYGVALLVVPMLIVAVARHRARPLIVAGVTGAVVLAIPLLWGFWWLDGLRATKEQYDINLVRVRPYYYWVFGNLAAMAFAVGPAVVAGVTWLRDRPAWLVVGGGLATILLADLSGLANAETERIWQPFLPLVLLGGAGLAATGIKGRQWWLAVQVVVAIGLQALLRSPW